MPAATTRSGTRLRRRETRKVAGAARQARRSPTKDITILGRVGLAGRTGFYLILTALVIRIALLQGPAQHEANANGALSLVSRPVAGQVAIGFVAFGFVLFGIGRIIGATRDRTVSSARRWMTAVQGLFYLALAYVPASFLSGNRQTGSQQQQQKTTAELLDVPGGRVIVAALGVVVIAVCAVQIRGALREDFRAGLDLGRAPRLIRRVAGTAGAVGITARSLVFLPIGIFLIIAAVNTDPNHSYGTDRELLDLVHHTWGLAVLSAVALGLAVFVVFSAIETRYRQVVSAR